MVFDWYICGYTWSVNIAVGVWIVMTVIEQSPWALSSYCPTDSGDRLKYLIGFFVSVMSIIAFPLHHSPPT